MRQAPQMGLSVRALWVLALVTAQSPLASAQQPLALELPSIEVVATPIIAGNEVDDFAGVSSVVGEQQIRDLNAQDVQSALRRTPGVSISRYNLIGSFGGGEGGAIFVRGLGSSRPGGEVKTYIDGVPVMMGVFNHPLMDILPIDAARDIEVIKGAQPHRFGNTFSAINLSPKRMLSEGERLQLQLAGGSYSTYVQTLEAGYRKGPFDAYLSQGYRRSDGARDHADGRLSDVYGRLGYALDSHWDLSLTALHTDNRASDPGEQGRSETREGDYATRLSLGILTLSHEHEQASGSLKLYWNQGEGDWTDQAPPAGDTLTDWEQYGLRFAETWRAWSGGELLFGLDLDRVSGKTRFEPRNAPGSTFNGPTFGLDSPNVAVNHRFAVGGGWELIPSAGLRYYSHNAFGDEWAPQAGLIARNVSTELYATYARGVNYPGLDVVVFSQSIIPPLGESWRDLEAETLDHFEIGVRQQLGPRLHAEVTAFYDDGDNRYVIDPPPPPPPRYANLGAFRIRGAELTLNAAPRHDLTLFAGLTLLDTDPADLPYAPDTSVSLGANWQATARIQLNLDAEYVSSMQVLSQARRFDAVNTEEVDGYFLLNGRLSYELPMLADGSDVFLALENLINSDYEYRPDYPMPGTTAMLGVNLALR